MTAHSNPSANIGIGGHETILIKKRQPGILSLNDCRASLFLPLDSTTELIVETHVIHTVLVRIPDHPGHGWKFKDLQQLVS